MLKYLSINSLYKLALAEGEGVGTAYEYFVRRLVLNAWLERVGRPRRILIAGLPEKYGSSLDFLQLAAETAATVTVVDERPHALTQLWRAFRAAQAQQRLLAVYPMLALVDSVAELSSLSGSFDLAISSEVLQRLPPGARGLYASRLRSLARSVTLFAPNEENSAHATHSGLEGVTRHQMNSLARAVAVGPGRPAPRSGHIDLPPFPPGVTRTAAQRQQAAARIPERAAMRALEIYGLVERFLPLDVRRRRAHIVYLMMAGEIGW